MNPESCYRENREKSASEQKSPCGCKGFLLCWAYKGGGHMKENRGRKNWPAVVAVLAVCGLIGSAFVLYKAE